jgi:hypothetical protein
MKFIPLILAATLTAAAPVQQPMALHPGETVTLRVHEGRVTVIERGAAPPLSAYEAEMVRRLQAQEVPAGSGVQPAILVPHGTMAANPPTPVPGQVRLTFRHVSGARPGSDDSSVLLLVNGYGASFRYRAVMHKDGRASPTDVCEVPPQLSGTEHWPYAIDQLDISDAHLEPVSGGEIRCE